MATTPPALGYGTRGEAPIDAVNQWMRSQGWYAQLLSQWGQSPSNAHLSDYQKQAVIKAAQAHGVVVDEGGDGQEIDDSGNFRAKGHGLRNTLIVAGIAAAALAAPYVVGALGGGGGAAAGGAAAGASTLGPSTAANIAATSAIAGGSAVPASLAATVGGSAAAAGAAGTAAYGAKSSLTSDLLRYGLPTAGGVVSGIIQAKAAGAASDAEQKYLEEALAYEKEKDAGNISREAGRYADFQGNIAPYLARGNSAGNRMSALLGLPGGGPVGAPSPGGSGSGGYVDPITSAGQLPAADRAKIDALLQKYNSGDTPEYWYGIAAQHGGFDKTGADWLDHRISIGDNAGKGYSGAAAAPTGNRYGTQPVAGGDLMQPSAAPEMVTVQAPDGTQRTVSRKDADHYIARGATLVGAAA